MDDIRLVRLHRFPWGLVYRIQEEQMHVLAVTHLHCEPGYWLDRIWREKTVVGHEGSSNSPRRRWFRFRFSLRTLLLVVTVVAILFGCGSYLYSVYELEWRRKHTLERLDYGIVGTDSDSVNRDRANRDRVVKAVQAATHSSLLKPELVMARVWYHRDLGYCVIADWICREPIADGIQITFADGLTCNIRIWEPCLLDNESNSRKMVLFQGVVYRDEFPSPANQTTMSDVVSIALLSGDRVCSNSLQVED